MSTEDDVQDSDFQDTGPFCRHWGEPGCCDVLCARCGHTCGQHADSWHCEADGCTCESWVEPAEGETP